MKKMIAMMMALALMCPLSATAQQTPANTPPAKPQGEMMEKPDGELPEGMGEPPEKPDGEMPEGMGEPPERPEGEMPMGAPGGMQGAPEEYQAVYTVNEDAQFTGELLSGGTDENVIHVTAGTAEVSDASIVRTSENSTGGDAASFYGVGAAVLATGGTAVIENAQISTDAAGGAGVFAYGDGVAYVSDTTITTQQDTSGGIHVAGGGTLYAKNLTVTTEGESAAAIRSDRGSGLMAVDGGSYTSNGTGSPAVYVTADISIHDAKLTATGSEALCMEGLNNVRLYDCDLSGNMKDLQQNDNTWTVIVYQSMSGDSEVGEGRFEMQGGTLKSENGGLFYTTNTESEFVLRDVAISASEGSEYFLRVTGNQNERGWGERGNNGADCKFTALNQKMEGNVIWDSISNLNMYIAEKSELTGAVINDESCAGAGGDGACNLYIEAGSTWIVTGDSVLTKLDCAGEIKDIYGNDVPVYAADGTLLRQGESGYSVVVKEYASTGDVSGMGEITAWEDHAAALA